MKKKNSLLLVVAFILMAGSLHAQIFGKKKPPAEPKPFDYAQSDPVLEPQLAAAAQAHLSIFGANIICYKARISGTWTIERNSLTGIILKRTIVALVLFRWNDGKCYSAQANYSEAYDGTQYSGYPDCDGVLVTDKKPAICADSVEKGPVAK
jgi:hypothetical protein